MARHMHLCAGVMNKWILAATTAAVTSLAVSSAQADPASAAARTNTTVQNALHQLSHGPEREAFEKQPIQIVAGRVQTGQVAKTVVWYPTKPVEIQVTKPDGGWIRRDVVIQNPVKRFLYNATASQRVKSEAWTGGPPQTRAITPAKAAAELKGMSGTTIVSTFKSNLAQAATVYPPKK